MKRETRIAVAFLLLLNLLVAPLLATHFGTGVGIDPTGVLLVGVLADVTVGDLIDVRAQLGITTQNMGGLMLLGGAVLAHQVFPPFDPYLGGGIGLALTSGFSTGFTVEGLVGTRVALFAPVAAFVELRYIARISEIGLTAGPLFAAGLLLSF